MSLENSNKNEFRITMSEFLSQNFSDVLLEDKQLLMLPNGLDLIFDQYLPNQQKIAA